MYKVDVRVDTKESAAVERRRIQEEQRKSRIFDARQRLIGVDVNALDQQVKERSVKNEIERQRDDAFATDMVRNDKIVEILDDRQAKDIRRLNMELNDYRKEYQRPLDRKEYDLNDPNSKMKERPARVSDSDPRCSMAGAQKLVGEDLGYEGRKKQQQEQIREWTRLQMEDKQRRGAEEDYSNKLYDKKAVELDERLVDLSIAEEQTRKALNLATKEYNLQQAKEKAARDRLRATQELEDNYTEMNNMIHGDTLSENPIVSTSAFGPSRVIPDRWKGMSPDQVKVVRDVQAVQREEKRRLAEGDAQVEKEWDRRRVAESKAGIILERQEDRMKRELRKKLAEENKQLAMEQKYRTERMDKEVYTNKPTSQFFDQFNRSTR